MSEFSMRIPLAKPTTVMVLGGSSSEGTALVRALCASGHRVVAVESDPLAVSLRLASLGAVVPSHDDPDYGTTLAKVASRSGARAVVVARREELSPASLAKDQLEEAGASLWAPSREAIDLCSDRDALVETLISNGLRRLEIGLGTEPLPGETAKDSEIRHGVGHEEGRRFSVDIVAGRDYDLLAAVSSWWLTDSPSSLAVAETYFDARLLDLARAVCASIRIEGPVVIEGHLNQIGWPSLSSIRPGFSPLLPISLAAGVDLASLVLAGTLGYEMPFRLIQHRPGVRMLQYLDQVFEG
jgi:hypothetical protein